MGILDGIVEWIAEQVMHGLDIINILVLDAPSCDMSIFLRYFPAAKTMYGSFVALAIGLILTPAYCSAEIVSTVLRIGDTPYNWILTAAALTIPTFALTESEVEAQVSTVGKEAVFFCRFNDAVNHGTTLSSQRSIGEKEVLPSNNE